MANFIPTPPASFCFSGTIESALGAASILDLLFKKRKKRRAICPQPLELPFPALHSLFVFFPVGLRKFFRRHAIQAMVSAKSIMTSSIFFRSNGGATLLPAPTGQDFLMRQRPNSNRQKCHTWENHPWWERWQRRSYHAFRERKFDSTRAPETGESDGRVNYRHGVCAHVLLLQRRREHSWLVL